MSHFKEKEIENNGDDIYKTYKHQDALMKLRKTVLLKACEQGEIDVLNDHLHKIDNKDSLLSILLATCVFYDKQESFDIIFNYIKCNFIKFHLCGSPYGLKFFPNVNIAQQVPSSLLEIAARQNNFVFFEQLLKKYNYSPDASFASHELILERMIKDKRFQFSEALLQAGANPNVYGQKTKVVYSLYLDQTSTLRLFKRNIIANNVPLIVQAITKDCADTVKLLIAKGAKTNDKISLDGRPDKLNTLLFILNTGQPEINEDILEMLLKAGNNINEKINGFTLLQICFTNKFPASYFITLNKFGATREGLTEDQNKELDTILALEQKKEPNVSIANPAAFYQPAPQIQVSAQKKTKKGKKP